MKVTIFLTLISCVLSASISHVEKIKRQEKGGKGSINHSNLGGKDENGLIDMTGFLQVDPRNIPEVGAKVFEEINSQKAMKIESIPPIIRKEATRVRLIYGPYKVRAEGDKNPNLPKIMGNLKSLDPAGTGYIHKTAEDFPSDITVLDSTSSVVDSDFHVIDRNKGLYDHHHVFLDVLTPVPSIVGCEDSGKTVSVPLNTVIGGAVDSARTRFTSMDGTFNSGYYFPKNRPMLVMLDILNYGNITQDLYTVSEMEYIQGKESKDTFQSSSLTLDVAVCNGGVGVNIAVPKDRAKFTIGGKELVVANPGYFLYFRGHMHDGGKNIEVKINNNTVCSSDAQYGGEGHEGIGSDGKNWTSINGFSTCTTPIKVEKGDKVTIEAHFDMDEHPARKFASGAMAEVMALLVTNFATKST